MAGASILATICAERMTKVIAKYSKTQFISRPKTEQVQRNMSEFAMRHLEAKPQLMTGPTNQLWQNLRICEVNNGLARDKLEMDKAMQFDKKPSDTWNSISKLVNDLKDKAYPKVLKPQVKKLVCTSTQPKKLLMPDKLPKNVEMRRFNFSTAGSIAPMLPNFGNFRPELTNHQTMPCCNRTKAFFCQSYGN